MGLRQKGIPLTVLVCKLLIHIVRLTVLVSRNMHVITITSWKIMLPLVELWDSNTGTCGSQEREEPNQKDKAVEIARRPLY